MIEILMSFLLAISALVGVGCLIRAYVECRKQTRRHTRALGIYVRRAS